MQQTPFQGNDQPRREASPDGYADTGIPMDTVNERLLRELDSAHSHERALQSELADAARRAEDQHMLLREADHRLKNMLHLACAMLQSQARGADGKSASDELQAASARLKAMAEMQTGLHDLGEVVQLDQWLPRVCRSMAFRPGVELDVRVPRLAWPAAVASPLGLFACEAVCNAMKHAYGDNDAGRILVQLARQDDDWRLSVSDNGHGGPAQVEPGFGLRLLGLLARQVGGRLDIARGLYGRGLSVSAVFPAPTVAAQPSPNHA